MTSFGHKARTWLLSDHMHGLRHHGGGGTSFGRGQCGSGGGALASGRILLDLDLPSEMDEGEPVVNDGND